jgi:hypothetical protein
MECYAKCLRTVLQADAICLVDWAARPNHLVISCMYQGTQHRRLMLPPVRTGAVGRRVLKPSHPVRHRRAWFEPIFKN